MGGVRWKRVSHYREILSEFRMSRSHPITNIIQNITGSFTLPGRVDIPFTYYVRCVRDGGMYCLRSVDVRQEGGICFTCICSFKRLEKDNPYTHQKKVDISQKYRSVLRGKKIEDHQHAPGADVRWWVEGVKTGRFEEEEFPGIEVRRVDMREYNDTQKANENPDLYRQLQFYRFIGSPSGGDDAAPPSEEEREKDARGEYDNLYACAHLYTSDKNSLFVITTALDLEDRFVQMASLSHTVIFHTPGEALRMIDWKSTGEGGMPMKKKWFVQEASTSRSDGNRGIHESRLWAPDGTMVATTLQDGMVRVKPKERAEKL
jgi:acyl-CoA thioesterase II